MPPRLTVTFLLLVAGIWAASCSSGLGNDPRNRGSSAAADANANLPVGFDLGFVPTAAVTEPVIAGCVVPAIGATGARDVVLLAFTTAAAANDGDGSGSPLAKDTTTDANGAADVFVALVSAQSVDERAFSQSLAGKFRHPRCATCHSMSATDTTAFTSSLQPHAGPPPGDGFPFRQPEVCAPCHVTSSTFPVVGWQAPESAIFDIRPKTVAQLMQMAQNVPADETEHFVTDKRVLWALDSGVLPAVGGRNGIADDNQDGVLDPEDNDGVARTVPGGSATFLRQIEEWRASGMLVSNAAAVLDLTLLSRAAGSTAAGNGASSAPQVKWVPNAGFDPANAAATNPIGTLFVAFQSSASDLVAGDGNARQDVFRAAVELRAEENATGTATAGGLNLVALDSTLLCSALTATATVGNQDSGRPVIGGANAEFVAFESAATNLVTGFVNGNGAAADVYLRTIGASLPGTTTQLVSHLPATTDSGGNGASERPSLAADGSAVAFESDASDLVNGDGNGVRDVFVAATVTAPAPFVTARASVTGTGLEGTGGASRNASVHSASGRRRVAFESDKTDLATGLVAATNVFLFDSGTGTTQLLNRRVSPGVTTIGDGAARRPVFLPDGRAVAFESEAKNIDVLRTDDNRFGDIYLVETDQLDAGRVLPFRISVTANEAATANGASSQVTIGAFTNSANFQTGFAAYTTQATNLGTSDTTNVMVTFLDETSGILVDFAATPAAGLAPLQVQFTDASTGSPTAWAWDFDNDGTVDSTAQNPTTTYAAPGDYTVKLTVQNRNTEADATEAAFVHVVGPTAADFSASPTTTGGAPLTVLFADASSQPNGSVSAWAWDFDGNGTTDSTAQNPSFTYTTPGTFTVTLTATGESGSAATATRTALVTVTAPGSLVASFTSIVTTSPLGGRAGTAVGSVYDDETITFSGLPNGATYLWNFGDGTTSTQQNPTHVFATPGTYNVFLTVTNGGDTDTEVKPALITSVLGATTVVLEATQDNTIFETFDAGPPILTFRSNNFGGGADMVAGTTISRGPRRAMVQFDVSSVPSASVLQSANLQLTNTSPSTAGQLTGTQTFTIRRITNSWTEGTTATGTAGQGAASQGGGATWLRRTHPSTLWTAAGGDFAGSTGTIQITDASIAFQSTDIKADVQTWLASPATNFGWMLVGNEGATKTVKWFATRENTTAAARPKLTVVFRPPLP